MEFLNDDALRELATSNPTLLMSEIAQIFELEEYQVNRVLDLIWHEEAAE